MAIKAWEEIGAEPLAFPIRGKTYVVPELGWEEWLTLQAIQQGANIDIPEGDDAWKLVLGSVLEEMKADNLPVAAIERAGYAALTDVLFGREMAEAVWEAGIDPKEIRARVLANLGVKESTPSLSTESESQTPSPDSSSPTTSPKKSSPRKKVAHSPS